MPTKLTHKQIRECLEVKGLTLLTKEYVNTLQKLEISCPLHGVQIVTAKQIRLGGGCFKCGQEIKVAHRRIPIDLVRADIESAGYELLSKTYKSNDLPLEMKCPKHGEFTTSYYTIKSGHGCRSCGYESVGNKKRTPFEEIVDIVAKTPYILISKTRTNHKQKITLKCKIHGQFEISLCHLKMGQGCFKCGHAAGRMKSRISHEDFCKRISHFGYEVLTPYITSHDYITVKCPKHGEFSSVAYSLLQGHRCAKCADSESKAEMELFDAIKKAYLTTKKLRSRVNIEGKEHIKRFEIDIYVKEKKRGIEFDGTHWHKFETMRADDGKKKWSDEDLRNYHEIKDAHFLSIGIQILHIKEEEWNLDKQACIDRCLAFLSQ